MPTKWQEAYPRNRKPSYDELLNFMPDDIRALFLRFNAEMNAAYNVYNKWQRYESARGWVYGYCRNYRVELLSVSIGAGCFGVLGVDVSGDESLSLALRKAKEVYDNGYEDRYAAIVSAKKSAQIERAKVRSSREKEQMAKLTESVAPERLNRFKWPPKVSRQKIIAMYKSEAQGLLDAALLDDVGYAFYVRCKQVDETRELLEKGRIICHHCGEVLQAQSYTDVIPCACGYSYTYREYRRSCNAANIPGGRATPIFHDFAAKWPGCKTAGEKMLLIDRLIHECHVTLMSGEKGRSVCVNLIEGTIPQLRDMLEMLAGH